LHRDGRTIVMVTHAADVAARAPRRITLHDGRISAEVAASSESTAKTPALSLVR
jgi:putative ABC transport system ATP-binding protein